MTRIFLAYHPDDTRAAEEIVDHLENNRHDVWYDKSGDASTQEVAKQLKKAQAFIYVMSPTSVTYPACRLQLQEASKQNLLLIPTVIHPQTPVLPQLQGRPVVNMMGGVSISGLEQLLQAVGQVGGKSKGGRKKEKNAQSAAPAASASTASTASTQAQRASRTSLGTIVFELMLVTILVLAVVLGAFVLLNTDDEGPVLGVAVVGTTDPGAALPGELPTALPTEAVIELPTELATELATELPSLELPTELPTAVASEIPDELPTAAASAPVELPTELATDISAPPVEVQATALVTEEQSITAAETAAATEPVAIAQATEAPSEDTPTSTSTATVTPTPEADSNNTVDPATTEAPAEDAPTPTVTNTASPTEAEPTELLPSPTQTFRPARETASNTPTLTPSPSVTATPTVTDTPIPAPTEAAEVVAPTTEADLLLRWNDASFVIFNASDQTLSLSEMKFALPDLSDHFDGGAYLGIDFTRNFNQGRCEIISADEGAVPGYCEDFDFTTALSRTQSSYVWVWDAAVNPSGVFIVTLNDVPIQECAIADGECAVNIPYAALGGQIPSSGWIAFSRGGDLFVMNGDGENIVQLTDSPAIEKQPAFSPDGGRIVYASNEGGSDFELFIMNLDGSNVEQLTGNEADDTAPVFAPGGDRIAFQSNRDGNSELYVLTLSTNDLRRVTNTNFNEQAPNWGPDGRTLYYQSDEAGDWDIYATDVNVGGRVQLTSVAPDHQFPVLASDGETLYFSSDRQSNNYELWSVIINQEQLAVNTLTRLTNDGNVDTLPAVAPDGNTIVFVSVLGDVPEIRTLDPRTGTITTLGIGTDPDFFPLRP